MYPLIGAIGLTGCEGPDTAELLTMTIGGPVLVDTFCDGGICGGTEWATATLTFTDNLLLSTTARVEFQQYRIDYDFSDATPPVEMPSFSESTWGFAAVGKDNPFDFRPASDTQRNYARNSIDSDATLSGTATLHLAGYDQKNAIVEISQSFPIQFLDLLQGIDNPIDTGGVLP